MTRDNWARTIVTFVLGVGVGSVAALLFAPKAREELRGNIAECVSNGVKQVRSTGKDLRQRAQKVVGLAKGHVQDAIEAGDKAYTKEKSA